MPWPGRGPRRLSPDFRRTSNDRRLDPAGLAVDPTAVDPSDFNKVLHVATPWATGLWPINGCTFGPDGSFYASELITHDDFGGGDVVKIPFATPGVHIPLTGDSLTFPAGVAVGPDGHVYVANGTAFATGQVVRLTLH